jgi:DNA-directed RNA polymerase subunit omega
MLDELKEEGIVNKVGGRFKLSTLIQKRMAALNTGAKPLVHVPGGDKLMIIVQEILQDKIYLDLQGEVMEIRNATTSESIRNLMVGQRPSASMSIPAPSSRDDDDDE